jgi:hypothetical protein
MPIGDLLSFKPVGEAINSHAQTDSINIKATGQDLSVSPKGLIQKVKAIDFSFSYLYSPHLLYSPHILYPWGKFPGIYPQVVKVENI